MSDNFSDKNSNIESVANPEIEVEAKIEAADAEAGVATPTEGSSPICPDLESGAATPTEGSSPICPDLESGAATPTEGTSPICPDLESGEAKPKKKKKKKLPPKVITVEDLGVRFRLADEKVDNLKEYFIKLVKRNLRYKEFWALNDISFNVRRGERVGILGLNGAGKSTMLKVIAGVLKPTTGSVTIKGNVVPLLELGAGFDKDYTGAENIFLYGTMLGFSRAFLKEKFSEIVEFSELGDFINVPLKNYSSGMKARLGFSVATIVEPEILILDEVLSVGDAKFRKKSEKKIKSMMKKGTTVLFVSHSIDQVRSICNKAIILEKGKLIASGKVDKVAAIYEEMIGGKGEK